MFKGNFKNFESQLSQLKLDSENQFANWLKYSDSVKRSSVAMLLVLGDKNFHYYLANIAACSKSKLNAKLALENLLDETKDNHPRLNNEFAKQLNIDLLKYAKLINPYIAKVDKAVEGKNNTVFLSAFMAAVEACSPIMMRAMMTYAKSEGVKRSKYIEVHTSPLEEHHAEILLKGLYSEMKVSNGKLSEAMNGLNEWRMMMKFIFKLK